MMLHHIGIVVDSLAEALPLFQVWMRAKPVGGIVEDHTQGARIQLCVIAPDSLLEIVEPIPGEENFLHRQDGFHLCFTVPDLDAEMARLHEMGAVVIQPPVESATTCPDL